MTDVALRDVSRVFSDRFALRRIDLDVSRGEALAITGANGSGKTTLLRLVSTLLRPSSGSVTLFGKIGWENRRSIRPRIGVMFVEGFLHGDLTVRENLRFFGNLHRLKNPDETLTRWLDRLGIRSLADEAVGHLSRGERQRVSLARSLLHDPELLLWDEPTSGLDDAGRERFREIALEKKGKRTILCATHDRESIRGWVDREIRLEKGRVA